MKNKSDNGAKAPPDKKISHNIRAGWRWSCWAELQKGSSYASKAAKEVQYSEKLYKFASAYRTDPVARTLLIGAFHSPADVKASREGRGGDKVPKSWKETCPFCSQVGTHHHMFWDCEKDPKKLSRPEKPEGELQSRLGWAGPSGTNEEKYARTVIEWQCRIVEEVWFQRYGKTPRRSAEGQHPGETSKKKREETRLKEKDAECEEPEIIWTSDDDLRGSLLRQALHEVIPDNFSMEASRDSPPQAKKEDGPPDAVYQQGKVRGVYRYGVHSVCDGNTTECGSMCEELPWPPEDCLRQVSAAAYLPRRRTGDLAELRVTAGRDGKDQDSFSAEHGHQSRPGSDAAPAARGPLSGKAFGGSITLAEHSHQS